MNRTEVLTILFLSFCAVVPALATRSTSVFDTRVGVSLRAMTAVLAVICVVGKLFAPWDLGPFVHTARPAWSLMRFVNSEPEKVFPHSQHRYRPGYSWRKIAITRNIKRRPPLR